MSIKNYGFGSSIFFLHPIFVRYVSLLSSSTTVFEQLLSIRVWDYDNGFLGACAGAKVFGYSNTMHHALLLFE